MACGDVRTKGFKQLEPSEVLWYSKEVPDELQKLTQSANVEYHLPFVSIHFLSC